MSPVLLTLAELTVAEILMCFLIIAWLAMRIHAQAREPGSSKDCAKTASYEVHKTTEKCGHLSCEAGAFEHLR